MKYPLPSYAASIWLADNTLWLGLPGRGPEDRGHSIPVPATAEGMAQVLRILKARERDQASVRIGDEGSPTRAQLEAIMRKREQARAERQAQANARVEAKPVKARALTSDEILAELGMI